MGLYDHLSERVTDKILKMYETDTFRPLEDDDWLNFKSVFIQKHNLPESKFDGKLIDGRSKKNKK